MGVTLINLLIKLFSTIRSEKKSDRTQLFNNLNIIENVSFLLAGQALNENNFIEFGYYAVKIKEQVFSVCNSVVPILNQYVMLKEHKNESISQYELCEKCSILLSLKESIWSNYQKFERYMYEIKNTPEEHIIEISKDLYELLNDMQDRLHKEISDVYFKL